MKKSITACLIVVALIAFTTKPTMAEPITLTVMAITGLTVVATMAGADTAYQEFNNNHNAAKDSRSEEGSAALQKNADRAQMKNDSKGTPAGREISN
jgi:hypothetical protein